MAPLSKYSNFIGASNKSYHNKTSLSIKVITSMELPHIGKSCSNTACNRLDFLPYKCDLCSKIFCQDHREYRDHNCPEQYRVDQQVPVCPKCGEIIPIKPGDDPNIKV